jgi:hypothetical protein
VHTDGHEALDRQHDGSDAVIVQLDELSVEGIVGGSSMQ